MVQAMSWSDLGDHASGDFEPRPFYDGTSDCVTLFVSPDESYRERVDHFLTVYRSVKTNEVVGCHIKDVRKVLDVVRAFNIGIQTSGVTIGLLLLGVPCAGEEPGTGPITVHSRNYLEIVEPLTRIAGATKVPELV